MQSPAGWSARCKRRVRRIGGRLLRGSKGCPQLPRPARWTVRAGAISRINRIRRHVLRARSDLGGGGKAHWPEPGRTSRASRAGQQRKPCRRTIVWSANLPALSRDDLPGGARRRHSSSLREDTRPSDMPRLPLRQRSWSMNSFCRAGSRRVTRNFSSYSAPMLVVRTFISSLEEA